VWGSSWASVALPCCCRLNGLYRVHGLRVSSHCLVARWHFLPSLSFQKVCCFVFLSFTLLFHYPFFLFLSFLSLAYWPFRTRLLACLIRAAILHFSFRLHLLDPDALSSVVLISDLLYQSAAFIFLDGRVGCQVSCCYWTLTRLCLKSRILYYEMER